MLHNIFRLLKTAAAVVFWSTLSSKRRKLYSFLLSVEWRRLVISYADACCMAISAYGHWGVTEEIFDKYYQRDISCDKHTRPLDAYHSIMEELAITHEPDPEIWS